MMKNSRIVRVPRSRRSRDQGAVLVVGLVLLLVLTLAGVILARMQTVEERMARNEDNHQLALQGAEAALRAAEAALSCCSSSMNFAGNANGYYTLNPNQGSVVDQLNTSNWSAPTTLTYTGPALNAVQSYQSSRYVIELLPPVAPPGSSIAAPSARGGLSVQLYRITARGYGGDGTSTATLQSVYYIP